MVGRDVSEEFPPRRRAGRDRDRREGALGAARFSGVSFSVRRGEIVGLAGLVGAGDVAVWRSRARSRPAATCTSARAGPVPAEAIGRGVAYLTEDRKGGGCFR